MSESSLVEFRDCSSGKWSNRGGNPIRKVIFHHAAGIISLTGLNNVVHNSSRQASYTYGIGYDARVGQYVPEAYRPWTTGSFEADKDAVTIEVSNSAIGGNWPVSDAVLNKLIDLVADVCRRNGIKPTYTGDKNGTLQYHQMWDNTACPGPYLISKMSYICQKVNEKLGNGSTTTPSAPSNLAGYSDSQLADMVIQGVFGNGDARRAVLGSRYAAVQALVNQKIYGGSFSTPAPAAVDYNSLADAVIRGDYGNGDARRNALDAKYGAGTYDKVQAIVNQKLMGSSASNNVNLDAIATDVIRGVYGNGAMRKANIDAKFGPGVYEQVQAIVNNRLL